MADIAQTIGKLIFSVIWIVLLIFVAWPVAYFVAPFWVFILPFEPIADMIKDVNALLFKLVVWPKQLAIAALAGSDKFPNPFHDSSYTAIV